jgi:hypothetical protein
LADWVLNTRLADANLHPTINEKRLVIASTPGMLLSFCRIRNLSPNRSRTSKHPHLLPHNSQSFLNASNADPRVWCRPPRTTINDDGENSGLVALTPLDASSVAHELQFTLSVSDSQCLVTIVNLLTYFSAARRIQRCALERRFGNAMTSHSYSLAKYVFYGYLQAKGSEPGRLMATTYPPACLPSSMRAISTAVISSPPSWNDIGAGNEWKKLLELRGSVACINMIRLENEIN